MHITVVGSGFVGQASGKGFAKHGHKVTFVDISQEKVDQLKSEGFDAFKPSELKEITGDVTLFSVYTPTVDGEAVFDYLEEAIIDFAKRLKKHKDYHVMAVRSTTLPRLTRERFIPLVEKISGKKAGEDFGVSMQPEYLRQATAQSDFDRPWFTFIGELDKRSGDVMEELYKPFNSPIQRGSLEEAEVQKYIHNVFNAVKIAFFNEVREICDYAGLDADAIFPAVAASCEGCWNPMYGLRDRGPFDGACLPKDTEGFRAWATKNGYETPILDAVISQNKHYKEYYEQKQAAVAKNESINSELAEAAIA